MNRATFRASGRALTVWLPVLCLIILPLLFLWKWKWAAMPILLVDEWRLIHHHLVMASAWKNFEWPFWNPYWFSGAPLLADPHAAALYPFTLLFLLLPPQTARPVLVLLHYILAGVFTYRYARAQRLGPAGALALGLLFQSGVFLLGRRAGPGAVCAAAWLPLFLYCLEKLRRGYALRYVIGGSALFALIFFAGHPPVAGYVYVIGALYVIGFASLDRDRRRAFLKSALAVYLFGLMMASMQILPTLERSKVSWTDFTDPLSETGLHEYSPAQPRFWPVARVEYQKGERIRKMIKTGLDDTDQPIDWTATAFVETIQLPRTRFDPAADVSVLDRRFNQLVLQVKAQGPAFLVCRESYYPGWRAYVDNRRTGIYKTNGVLRGIEIPPGAHRLAFNYVPLPFYRGVGLFVLAWAGLLGLGVYKPAGAWIGRSSAESTSVRGVSVVAPESARISEPATRAPRLDRSERVFVAVLMAVYLLIACAHLNRPGIQYDEVTYGAVALGIEPAGFIEHTVEIMGKRIHTMTMPYIGALKAYLYMPIFKFFGVSPLAIRIPAILLAAFSLPFFYLWIKRTFDRPVAQVTLVLTAIDPSLVFHTRMDWGPVDIMLLLKAASLYFLAGWVQTKRTRDLIWGAFLTGLAMSNEATFIWHLASMGLAILLIFRREVLQYITPKPAMIALLFFSLGALPLIQYNLATGFKTFQNQAYVSRATVGSVSYKADVFADTLNGSTLYERVNAEPLPFGLLSRENKLLGGNLMALLFLVAAPFALFQKRDRWIQVLVLYMAIFLAQMLLIMSAGKSHHFIIPYPFPQIVVAWALLQILGKLKTGWKPALDRLTLARLGVLCLIPVLVADLYIDFLYVRSFTKIGGRGTWSDAIYDLTAFARSRPDRQFVLIEWGLNNQLLLLSKGAIKLDELCWAVASDDYQPELRERFQNPSNLYVLFAPDYRIWPEAARFHEVAKSLGLEEHPYKTFYQRDGRPIYVLYEVKKPS